MAIKPKDWLQLISQDKKFQENHRHRVWKDNIERYAAGFHAAGMASLHGTHGGHGGSSSGFDKDFVNVNFVYAYIKTVMPAVYFKDPYIFIEGRSEEDLGKANVVEAIINYIWREINLKEEVKRVILDTLLFGIGWLKIGYTAEFGRTIEKSTQATPDRKTPEGKVIEFNEYIKEENVFGKRISPFRVIVPRGYHRFVDMPYIIEERLEDIEAVKENKSLKNTADLIPTHKLDSGFTSIKAPSMSSPENVGFLGRLSRITGRLSARDKANKVILWEIWDKRSQKIITLGKGTEKVLQEKDWDLDIEGFPYIPLRFNTIPNSNETSNFYPISDIEPLVPQIQEQSKLRTAMVKHRKRFLAKILVEKGAMDQNQMDIFKQPETGLIAEVNDITKILPMAEVQVPADVYRVNEVIKSDLREISGISQLLMGGGASPGINTATEANIAQQGAGLRISEKQDQIEDFTRDTARKLIQIMRQFVQREFHLRTMIEGKEVDISGDGETLKAEVDVKIEAGSTQPPTDTAVERKQLIDLTIGVLQQPAIQRFVNFRVLLQKIAKTFPALKDSKIFTGGIEDEQQSAQLENQLMLQGNIQVVGPNDDHDIHLEVHASIAQDPKTVSPVVAQHIQTHSEFIAQRRQTPAGGGRADALTPTNITEGGATRATDTFALGMEGATQGVGTQPPAGGR